MDIKEYLSSIGLSGAQLNEAARRLQSVKPTEDKASFDIVKERVEFLKDYLGASNQEICNMLKKCKTLLQYDVYNGEESYMAKIEELKNFAYEWEIKAAIKKDAVILSLPVNKLRIRLMLATYAGAKKILNRRILFQHEKKIWARLCLIRRRNDTPITLYAGEQIFSHKYGAPSEALLNMYPFDEKALYEIESGFAKKTKKAIRFNEEQVAEYLQ